MKRATRATAIRTAILALCIGTGFGTTWSSTAFATSITRASSFAYDSASGLINQEVVEPGTPALRLQTDTVYDAFGNKTGVTTSGVDIATRGSTTAYDTRGQFITSNTNALGQSETWQFDARFGKATSQTGPNGLTTTWSYDTFGRKLHETRPDGTQTAIAYVFCSGVNGGTAACITGAFYLATATPLASDGVTQNGPKGIVYFDSLDREIGRDTQGFDSSTVRALRQYDSMGRVQQTSRPFFVASGTPQYTTFTYDALGRALTKTAPDGSVTQTAYHGLVTVETNANNQTRTVNKNARGEVYTVTDALNQTMTYAYDPIGNLTSTTDSVGNVVSATYDLRGHKIASSDPDLGAWTYSYDTLSELVSQTDAKSQTTTFGYDKLGRLIQRIEPDMTCTWVYDTAAKGIGKLTSASITAGPANGYARAFAYDSLGRPSQTTTTVNSASYIFSAGYDSNGHLSNVTYPSGFIAHYSYNALGYSNALTDGVTNAVHWTLNTLDAEQHITQQTSGNGVVANQSFDPKTGRLLSVGAGFQNGVENLTFTYDGLGNLVGRSDGNGSFSETFTYDPLNRLTSAAISTGTYPAKNFAYDPIGNLTSKSDVGTYTYPTPGAAQPHAVTGIGAGTIATSFSYDANGNQTAGLGRSITWTSYNKPAAITQGSRTLSFLDDPNHQRFQQVTPQGTTLYFDSFGAHAEFMPGSGQWNEYLKVGNVLVGVRFLALATETVTLRYFHTDHLGSIAVITDGNGAVAERLSYDAWGKRRFANGADDPSGSITSQTTYGFTGQEELSVTGLVHLNGRVYDSLIGRMMSADPTVPDALNPQAWNRYSYVGNDPLTFTDPTGYSWLSSFFSSIGNFFRSIFSNSIVRAIVQIALAVILTPVFNGVIFLAAAASAAIVTGLAGGKLGQVLKAAVIAGAQAFAFDAVAGVTGHNPAFGTLEYFENVAGHAAVGCVSAVASGGKCGPGAISAGAGAAAAPLVGDIFKDPQHNLGDRFGGSAVSGVVGGLASVAGGGKFADGAVTAAFGYLFNSAATLTISGNIIVGPFVLYQGAFGLAVDSEGNVSYLGVNGFGSGVGARASVGVSASYSPDAQTNSDLGGPFWNVSYGGGLGPSASIDGYAGTTDGGRRITGSGATIGYGVGGGVSVTRTDTTVVPLFNLKNQQINPGSYNVP